MHGPFGPEWDDAPARAEPATHWQGEPVSVWRALWGVEEVEAWASLPSTNDRALEIASAAPPPRGLVVVLADEQTEGRGRRGARWHSPPGCGLLMSAVLPVTPDAHLPLLVGLAAAEAVEATAPGVRVGIKWPNDLVLGDRKVGGVLCESAPAGVIAGIGINVRVPEAGYPDEVAQLATALEEHCSNSVKHSSLAGAISRGLQRLCGGGVAARPARLLPDVLAALDARDVLAGRRVVTEEHGAGIARGIDAEGALLLERPDGSRVRVLAGSVRAV